MIISIILNFRLGKLGKQRVPGQVGSDNDYQRAGRLYQEILMNSAGLIGTAICPAKPRRKSQTGNWQRRLGFTTPALADTGKSWSKKTSCRNATPQPALTAKSTRAKLSGKPRNLNCRLPRNLNRQSAHRIPACSRPCPRGVPIPCFTRFSAPCHAPAGSAEYQKF